MKKMFQFAVGLLSLAGLTSCDKEGTCEERSSSGYYECYEDYMKSSCESGSRNTEFYVDKSCYSLGYTYKGLSTWRVSSTYPNPTPGRYGKWGTASSTGGSTSGVCSGAYVSPVSDAQLNAYCGAAYSYRCQSGKPLSDPSVQSVCNSYNTMRVSGVPDCKYCK